jgi:hypothetical protein
MRNKFVLTTILMLIVGLVGTGTLTVQAAPVNEGKVLEITGSAQYRLSGAGEWMNLEVGTILHEGDTVKTTKESEVRMELAGSAKTAEITIRQETELLFETFRHDPESTEDETMLNVDMGAVLVKAEKLVGDSKFEVKTPTSIVGIRGTTFEVYASKS